MNEMQTEIARVMTRAHPPLVMTLNDIADLMFMSYSHVKDDIQHRPGFPPKLERFDPKSPRWARDKILAYVGVTA